jgi:ribose transport system permease protein
MIRNGLNSEGINSFWQLVFTGGITLFAAVLDSYKSRANA